MNIKGNTRIEGEAVVESLPISASSLSTLVEVGGLLHKRQFSDIVLQPKEAYIPGLSVSFPSIFNLNTESLDYNNRSLVVSLKNQLAGTALLAPVAMNGTPAFRRIVKSDLTDAGVVFSDELSVFKIAQYNGDVNTFSNVGGYLETAKNTPVSTGTGNIISFGHQSYKTSIFSTSEKNGRSWIKVDGDGGMGDWRELYHSGNLINPASEGNYLGKNNTPIELDIDASVDILGTKLYVGSSGLWMNKPKPYIGSHNGQALLTIHTHEGGFGSQLFFDSGSNRILTRSVSLGNYTEWSEMMTENSNAIKYMYDGVLKTYSNALVSNTDANKLPLRNEIYALELPNGSGNTNFPLNEYGTLIRHVSNTFTTDIIGNNNGALSYRTFFNSNTGELSLVWRTVWDDKNLINPATQDWVTSQNYSKQTLTSGANIQINGNVISATDTTYTGGDLPILNAGTNANNYLWSSKVLNDWLNGKGFSTQTLVAGNNIQINGNVISATDTIPQGGGLAMLIAGTDIVGRVWTSKTLNDWVNTKIKPSVLEYTLQEGITNPLWSSNATGKYSIAIGSYANATGYNSLALLQGARADGFSSLAIGEYSQALGTRSVAIGSYVTSINESYSFGFAVTNSQAGCVAIGEFNADIPFGDGRTKTNNSETPLFIIGNGLSSMVRSNAQVTYRDGSTRNYGRQYYDETMRTTIDFTKDNTLADVKYVKENGGGGLPNDPFTSISSNGYAGDTIDNPKFAGTEPNDLDVIVLAIERGQGLNVWDKATVSGGRFSLFGIYLKTYKKVLLRGYYKNGSSSYVNNSYLFNATSKTLEWGWVGTAGVDYVLLGNVVDAQAGLILFNPR